MKAYLAGAIEHAPDKGREWRDDIGRFLTQDLRHQYYHPLIEEIHYLTFEERQIFRSLRATDLTRFCTIVRKLMRGDLHSIESEIDYIICLWDEYAMQGGGTSGELTMAFHRNLPVYMVTKIPVQQISAWILGCTTQIFTDFEQLKLFLIRQYNPQSVAS